MRKVSEGLEYLHLARVEREVTRYEQTYRQRQPLNLLTLTKSQKKQMSGRGVRMRS